MRVHALLAAAVLAGCEPPTGTIVGSTTQPAVVPPASEIGGFYWLDPYAIAGMPQPGRYGDLPGDLGFLVDEGITLLATVNQYPPDPLVMDQVGLDGMWWPVDEGMAPTQEVMLEYVLLVEERLDQGQAIGVHCTAGLGRTGTFLATWLVWEGYDAESAIARVRELRPGSIETQVQEDAVREFALGYGAQ